MNGVASGDWDALLRYGLSRRCWGQMLTPRTERKQQPNPGPSFRNGRKAVWNLRHVFRQVEDVTPIASTHRRILGLRATRYFLPDRGLERTAFGCARPWTVGQHPCRFGRLLEYDPL
jgi:hypothetical protein